MAKAKRRTQSPKQQAAPAPQEKTPAPEAAPDPTPTPEAQAPLPSIHDNPPAPEPGAPTPTPEAAPAPEAQAPPTPEERDQFAQEMGQEEAAPAPDVTPEMEEEAKAILSMACVADEADEFTEVRLELVGEAPNLRPCLAVFNRGMPDPNEDTGWACVARITLASLPGWASDLCVTQLKGNMRRDLSGWLTPMKHIRKLIGFASPTEDINIPPCVGGRAMQQRTAATPGAPPDEREALVRDIQACQEPLGDDLFFRMAYHDHVVPGRLSKEERDDVLYSRPLIELRSIRNQMVELVRIRRDEAKARAEEMPQGVATTGTMLPEEVARRAAQQDGVAVRAE